MSCIVKQFKAFIYTHFQEDENENLQYSWKYYVCKLKANREKKKNAEKAERSLSNSWKRK